MAESDKPIHEWDNYCTCMECKQIFGQPTGGGACPYCGSIDWKESCDK